MAQPTQFATLLDVINHCDDFPHPTRNLKAYLTRVNSLYHFKVSPSSTTLGYMLPSIAHIFSSYPGWTLNTKSRPRTLTLTTGPDASARSAVIATTLASLRDRAVFAVLSNWRDELKPAYGPSGALLFAVERAAFPLLGIVAYGVMLLAYTTSYSSSSSSSSSLTEKQGRVAKGKEVSGIWVQRRSRSARTHPGYLDATAAGGIPVDETPFATLLAEAEEEAALERALVGERARACGTLSYFHTRKPEMGGEVGLLQPGVHFLYELELGPRDGVCPRGNDPSVAGFELMTPEELRDEILAGRAKPWFALAAIAFFVRHGIITEENERDYAEICMRLHRHLEFPVFGASFLNR
ncbi:thiamine pyrophosphokinase-related protein-like protein [Xylaria cf. heliscus]|nr:thiamine pyrophosphokinase-related protein-like protein [Xylaria cf. heliscus]